MKVINLFGGPGIGKSTISAAVFVELKKNNFRTELRTEFAKDLIYEQRESILKCDQLYVFAKQNRKLSSLLSQDLEYVITDSPLFLQMIYNNPENLNQKIFEDLTIDVFRRYENINFLIKRNSKHVFQTDGRRHSFEESLEIDKIIKNKLLEHNVPFFEFENNTRIVDKIVTKILEERMLRG